MQVTDLIAREDADLQKVLNALLDSSADIAEAFRTSLVTKVGSANDFGDEQLSVDVIADDIIFKHLAACGAVGAAASEEKPVMQTLTEGGKYAVCFDPLDGSSIIDCNFAVGAIFGVWSSRHVEGQQLKATGRDLVASVITVFGPRTTVYLTLQDGVYEFTHVQAKQWIVSREKIRIAEKAKMFSPANLRAAQDSAGYKKLVDYWMENKYTLRYTGGMVPDVAQIFVKGNGVFCSPVTKTAKAKLRVAFECLPIAHLIEAAGGKSACDSSRSMLDVALEVLDQRSAICVGSAEEVDRFMAMIESTDA